VRLCARVNRRAGRARPLDRRAGAPDLRGRRACSEAGTIVGQSGSRSALARRPSALPFPRESDSPRRVGRAAGTADPAAQLLAPRTASGAALASRLFVSTCSSLGVRFLVFVLRANRWPARPAPLAGSRLAFEEGGSAALRRTPLPRPASKRGGSPSVNESGRARGGSTEVIRDWRSRVRDAGGGSVDGGKR